MKETQVAIIGAGLAGLSVAKKLISKNINVLLIEKSNCIGGKQKTSLINGYQCDHGFQILLSAYPEVAQQLDLKQLKPLRFNAGAKLWDNHSFKTLGDPISSPWLLPYLMYHPIVSWKDLLKLFKLKCYLSGMQSADIFALPNQTTYNAINDLKFSEACENLFIKPFFKGVFLDERLETSSRLFLFYWKCFLEGHALIPQEGIAAIPKQLSETLNPEQILLNNTVETIDQNIITTNQGERIKADIICCASDYQGASKLFNLPQKHFHHVKTFYFEAREPLFKSKYLYLDGTSSPINNFHNVSAINPQAAPKGKTLLSVTTLPSKSNTEAYEKNIIAALKKYNINVPLKPITHFDIKHALPHQEISYGVLNTQFNTKNIFFCGDWTIQGSIQGALYSGRTTAEQIIKTLGITAS